MSKKTTSFRLEPEVLKKLKYMSIEFDKPIGDIIETLVKSLETTEGLNIFIDTIKIINNEKFQRIIEECKNGRKKTGCDQDDFTGT